MDPSPAPSPSSDPTTGGPSVLLAMTGALILLTAFLNANPAFGVNEMWPWQVLDEPNFGPLIQAIAVLWMVVGLVTLVLAFSGNVRLRVITCLGLGILLTALLATDRAGIQITRHHINQFLALAATGGGCLLCLRPGTRTPGRLVAGIGALTYLVSSLVAFEARGGESGPRLAFLWDDIRAIADGQALPYDIFAYAWQIVLPSVLFLGGCVLALLLAAGFVRRWFVFLVFGLLAAGVVVPLPIRVAEVFSAADPSMLERALDRSDVIAQVVSGLIDDGIAMWFLLALTVADLRHAPAQEAQA